MSSPSSFDNGYHPTGSIGITPTGPQQYDDAVTQADVEAVRDCLDRQDVARVLAVLDSLS